MPDLLFTQSLSQFVDSHLGRGMFLDVHGSLYPDNKWHCRPIDKLRADVIVALTDNLHTCYIQYADEYSPHLATPLLWDFGAWTNQVDIWIRARERSRLERIQRHIMEANVKICVKKWMSMYEADIEQATQIVTGLLRRGKNKQLMTVLEIDKLIENESELI